MNYNGLTVAIFDKSLKDTIRVLGGKAVVLDTDTPVGWDSFINKLISNEICVLLLTEPKHIVSLFARATANGTYNQVLHSISQTVIGSASKNCTDLWKQHKLSVDFEPNTAGIKELLTEIARLACYLLDKKQTAVHRGADTTYWKHVDMRWGLDEEAVQKRHKSPFLAACRREPTDYTPIWLLRQAGRYQRAYRELKSDLDFLEMCKKSELTAEITLMAVERLGVDAAILFADILPLLQPLGFDLEYIRGHGPVIHNPIRSGADVDRLEEGVKESQHFVYETIRMVLPALPPNIPLIGFSGAPFTLAAYAIEGESTKEFRNLKIFMHSNPGAWHAFMEKLSRAIIGYLNEQISAGVQAIQLFDSWVGCLSPDDYKTFVLPHNRYIFSNLPPTIPKIHFGTGTSSLLELMKEAGGEVLGLDWRVDLSDAWHRLDYDVAVQGNLDPLILFTSPKEIRKQASTILGKAGDRPGHIFNLGHGILPGTPEENVTALVDIVHELGNK